MQQTELQKAVERASKGRRPDPYERVLTEMRYYRASERLRLDKDEIRSWPPTCAKWELHNETTVQLYAVDEWEVLDWFVKLVQKGDIAQLPSGTRLQLQEQYHALQARGVPELTKGPCWNRTTLPSLEELKEVQRDVQTHIETFLTTGTYTFTEFTPTILVQRDPSDARRLVDHEFVPLLNAKGMVYLFATLLRRVRLPIERCPWCQQVFLKPRKDAVHCSRECQYLHYAQKQRGSRPPGKRGRPRKQPKPQQTPDTKATTKKGVTPHGKKQDRQERRVR